MPANFNRIAPFYDQLAFLVYRNNLIEAKKAFFAMVPPNSKVLLMGGGTGNILNSILKNNPSMIIDFVEPSERMISIAQKNLDPAFGRNVNFICGDDHKIPADIRYDVCTSFFVMDCFTPEYALAFAQKITSTLKENGFWLFADFFETEKLYQRLLIRFMYRFFRVVSQIDASFLPDFENIFRESGFEVAQEKQWMNGLIRSFMLKKTFAS